MMCCFYWVIFIIRFRNHDPLKDVDIFDETIKNQLVTNDNTSMCALMSSYAEDPKKKYFNDEFSPWINKVI